MELGALIEIVTGLVLLYLLLGLVCTVINEAIASVTKLRARNLRARLREIIDDPGFKKRLDSTGLIAGLSKASGGRIGPSYIPSRTMALGIVEALDPDAETAAERKLEDIRAAIGKLPDCDFRRALEELANDAGAELQTFRENVADWFDDMMERVGGVYRRYLKALSMAVALVLAVALNADSIRIATALWNDDALRGRLADMSADYAETETGQKEREALARDLSAFPLGWDIPVQPEATVPGILSWIAGILMTALAVSLGAPFWFDILRRFASLRSSGQPPVRANVTGAGASSRTNAGS